VAGEQGDLVRPVPSVAGRGRDLAAPVAAADPGLARQCHPLFSANVTNPIEPYAALVRYYRERWASSGHDPADALVGAGTAGYYGAKTSQEAMATYRPIFEARLAAMRRRGMQPVFHSLEDAIERSSALIGSPQQIIDKVHRYHEQLGHEVLHIHADGDGLTKKQHRATLELFQSEIAPVLRREMPSRPFPPALACVPAQVDHA
jgi:alkanesulfonate monooxygenase SsuD/methylene tetrahydromethanopterin reductase-like flavin-dependent oxidoreductase (luciferase family)